MILSMRMFRRENGYYYESKKNKARSLRTKNKREASWLYNTLKREFLKGKIVQLDSSEKIILNDFRDKFFKKHDDISEKTQDAYDLAYRLLIDSIGGSTLLSRIDEKHINRFKNDCLARSVRKTSINTYLRHIRGILNKAYEWVAIKQKIKINFFKTGKRFPLLFSKSEVDKIIEYAKNNGFKMFRIIQFALYTGTRRKEICSLKWQDIGDGICRILGKVNKERTIALAPKALEVKRI